MYTQILLILTAKVHDILKKNFSKDLRDMLGSESTRLLHASCRHDITNPCIAFSAVHGFVMNKELRSEMLLYLHHSVNTSGAA